MPWLGFHSRHHTSEVVTITRDGKATYVALDASAESSDINIPVTALRHFAEVTDPYRLPPTGTLEKLALPTAESTEVEWLRRDDFSEHISGGNLQIHDIEIGRIPTAKNL